MFNDRSLAYFIAAAESLHMGRAAESLGIAQSALSQQIKSLETRLAVRLFDRAHRRIALTEAGALFLEEAKQLLAASARAVRRAREVDQGTAGELHIGYTGSVIFEPLLREWLLRFRSAFPDVVLTMHESAVQQQIDALQDDRLDLALLRGPVAALPAGIGHRVFAPSPLVVALPFAHRLAAAHTVMPADLARETFVGFPDPPGVGLGHSLQLLAARAGFTPHIALHAGSVMSALGLVSAGLGISVIPHLPLQFTSPSVALRPIDDPDARTAVHLLTRTRITSAVARRFAALANRTP